MNVLQQVREDAFLTAALAVSSAEGLASFLRARGEVAAVRRALESGELTADDVQSFVRDLLRGFRPGEKFTEEVAVAAIAIALESWPGDFASTYLADLGRVRVREMPLAPRIAALALIRRRNLVIDSTYRCEVLSVMPTGDRLGPREVEPIRIKAESDYGTLRVAS